MILLGGTPPQQSGAPGNAAKSWAHQRAAFEFVKKLWESGRRGAMLAMAMGTGKSKVAIDLALWLQARLILILCPLRVVEVWQGQFQRFAEGAYTFAALDDRFDSVYAKALRARELADWARRQQQPLILAVNYESARLDPFASWALNTAWPLTILDESHRIKDPDGRASRFAAKLALRSARRLCLTGTPMPHQPIDIWPQFRYLDRSILDPTFGSFKLRHALMGGFHDKQITGWRDLDLLYAKFAQIAFRVDDSVLDLPPELDQVLSTHLTSEGAQIYQEMDEEMVTWIRTLENQGQQVTAANAMVRLLRLQQITGGSLPDDRGRATIVDTAKENLLADFLGDLDRREPVVVFAWFKSDLKAIHRAAAKNDLYSGELSGDRDDLAPWKRGGVDDPTVLAVQIQAGGVGIDLTRSRLALYYSTGYSLALYLQSRARIRRPPQQRACVYYHLQVKHSIDEIVLAAIERRQELIESVLTSYQTRRS